MRHITVVSEQRSCAMAEAQLFEVIAALKEETNYLLGEQNTQNQMLEAVLHQLKNLATSFDQLVAKSGKWIQKSNLHTKRTGHAEFADKTSEAAKPISLEAPEQKDDVDKEEIIRKQQELRERARKRKEETVISSILPDEGIGSEKQRVAKTVIFGGFLNANVAEEVQFGKRPIAVDWASPKKVYAFGSNSVAALKNRQHDPGGEVSELLGISLRRRYLNLEDKVF